MTKEKKKFKTIFDTVSHIEKKRASQDQITNTSQKTQKTRQEAEQKAEKKNMLEQCSDMKKMYEDIACRLDHIFRYNNITPSQLHTYMSKPQHFSSQEWVEIQKQKVVNEELFQVLVDKFKKMQETVPLPLHADRTIEEKNAVTDYDSPCRSDRAVPNHIAMPQQPQSASSQQEKQTTKKKKLYLTKRDWLNMR